MDDNSNDDCRGDIGGPLICNVQRTWVLGGLLSYRSSCMPGPYVYTEAASTLQFLSSSQFLGNSLDLSVAARNAKETAIENDELPIRWLSHHMPSFGRPGTLYYLLVLIRQNTFLHDIDFLFYRPSSNIIC